MRSSRTARTSFSLLLAFTLLAEPAASARVLVDVTGARVVLKDRPLQIVTLAPSLGELAADLAGEDLARIVGVSEYTDYPPALEKVVSIGPYMRFNLEKVVALNPDLVLATLDGNPKDQVLHLRELKVPVVVVATSTLKEVEESILLIGQAMGAQKRAESMVTSLRTGVARFRERAAQRKTRRVMLQIGDDPLVVVGRESFLHEALVTVGGINLYEDATAHYPRPALEDAVKRDPDAIVVLALGKDLKPFQEMAGAWKRFPKLNAVSSGSIRVLQGDPILRPTLRLLEGLSLLERAVHGGK